MLGRGIGGTPGGMRTPGHLDTPGVLGTPGLLGKSRPGLLSMTPLAKQQNVVALKENVEPSSVNTLNSPAGEACEKKKKDKKAARRKSISDFDELPAFDSPTATTAAMDTIAEKSPPTDDPPKPSLQLKSKEKKQQYHQHHEQQQFQLLMSPSMITPAPIYTTPINRNFSTPTPTPTTDTNDNPTEASAPQDFSNFLTDIKVGVLGDATELWTGFQSLFGFQSKAKPSITSTMQATVNLNATRPQQLSPEVRAWAKSAAVEINKTFKNSPHQSKSSKSYAIR